MSTNKWRKNIELSPNYKEYISKTSGGKILESLNTSSVEDTDAVNMVFLENESYQKITLMEENYLDSSINLL